MKILITGGSGFVGTRVCEKLHERGHDLVVLTRDTKRTKEKLSMAKCIQWNPNHEPAPEKAFKDVEAVINLMGENIAEGRWTEEQKQKILESRQRGTKNLIQTMDRSASVKTFVSASAIGFYKSGLGQPLDESGPKGEGFLTEVVSKWEESAQSSKVSRKVIFRIGVVLGLHGGALSKLLLPFKMGLGGPVGQGKQMMSWIHLDDLAQLFVQAVEDSNLSGVYNACAPNPVSNKEFSQALAKALNRPCLFPVPPFVLKMALGEMSQIVLDSQIISSKKIENQGFEFQFPHVQEALKDIVAS